MQITRRTWLALVATALVACVAAIVVWRRRDAVVRLQAKEIAAYLRAKYSYLKLVDSDEDFARFYDAYRIHYLPIVRSHWHQLLKGRSRSYHEEQMEDLAETYLLSTDFFFHNADETQPVRFVALYHPYATPCWNPISIAAARAETEAIANGGS